ncbi:MAG: proton-conducting transporter transmembrane domain-containing protein [Thermoplasmataceae archaeon]
MIIIPFLLLLSIAPVIANMYGVRLSYRTGAVAFSVVAVTSLYLMLEGYTSYHAAGQYIAVGIDPLTSGFLMILAMVWALASLYSTEYDQGSISNSLTYNTAMFAMVILLLSRSFPVFLSAWETMTISGYFLIGMRKTVGPIPPYVFLVYGELSTLFIIAMGSAIYFQTGTMIFVHGPYNEVLLFLGIMGFFIKMGVMPFQITEWLPIAHGNATTNGSILFSATMTTAAVYSILRFILLSEPGIFFGSLLMSIGAFSLLFASIYSASSEHVKMLPAYSTIENGGAMLILLGAFVIASDSGFPGIAAFALAGLMVFVLAHSLAKCGLFMFSGIMEKASGSPEIKDYHGGSNSTYYGGGGILNSISLSGMLPLGGGIGEWMLLETLFILSIIGNSPLSLLSTVVGAAAALGGGISIISMTKIFGYGSRGAHEGKRKEGAMRTALLLAGIMVFLAGILSSFYIMAISPVVQEFTGIRTAGIISGLLIIPNGFLITSHSSTGLFGVVSPFFVALFIALFSGVMIVAGTRFRKREVSTWNGGIPEGDKLNSFAYANSLRLTMKRLYLTKEEREGKLYSERTFDAFWLTVVFLSRKTVGFSRAMGRAVMNSSLAAYVFYIMVAFFLVMIYVAS